MNQVNLDVSLLGGHPASALGQFCALSSGVASTLPGSAPLKLTASRLALSSLSGVVEVLVEEVASAGTASMEELC
jgi:hypothetical protein